MENVHCHESETWFKTQSLIIESSFAKGMFSTETLIGETILLVTKKNEFDYRDKTIVLNFLLNFLTIGIFMEILVSSRKILNNCRVCDYDLDGRNQAHSC